MVPQTADGRVMFGDAVDGQGTPVGTTDTPRVDLPLRAAPVSRGSSSSSRSGPLSRAGARRDDIRSLWVGIRPLVKTGGRGRRSRPRRCRASTRSWSTQSGLVTTTGGKWTTYRNMAEDVLEKCFDARLLAGAGRR